MRQACGAIVRRSRSVVSNSGACALALALAATIGIPAMLARAAVVKVPDGIRFTYSENGAGTVVWTGAFNNWSATAHPMTKDAMGIWSVVLPLPPGEHEYKFVVDGQWIADPENPVTRGDYGNSMVTVGTGGDIVAAQATSNTPYSPKIFMGGRVIGLYKLDLNRTNQRYELERPETDIDLRFDVRISDLVKARFLMNINAIDQGGDFFRNSLRFDRGALEFRQPRFQIFAYDNEAAGTWDDPLHLMGAVGIYQRPYGLGRHGFRLSSQHLGFETELHYADNFQIGGTDRPILDPNVPGTLVDSIPIRSTGTGYEFVLGSVAAVQLANSSDGNENTFAFRTRRELGRGWRAGLLARADRGFDLGTANLWEVTGPNTLIGLVGSVLPLDDTTAVLIGAPRTEEEWYAGGAELSWESPRRLRAFGEYLRGERWLNPYEGLEVMLQAQLGPGGIEQGTVTAARNLTGKHRTLDRSNRFRLGGSWREAHGDVFLQADMEREDHDYALFYEGIQTAVTTWRMQWDRNWRYYLNREVKTGLRVEFHDFDYDPGTPWKLQLWFPFRNFWLEHGQHVVGRDRLVMLGGNDVVSIRPSIEIPLWKRRDLRFRYDGIFNSVDFGTVPKYAESIFRLGIDVSPRVRLSTDTRWVRYDEPLLELDDAYVDHFVELDYRFDSNIDVAFSFGVDPYVIDPFTNENAYIGRDEFLIAQGANGSVAQDRYFELAQNIPRAERALQDVRRFQVKGTVHF